MKKFLLSLLALSLLSFSAYTNDSTDCKIVFYRTFNPTFKTDINIFINGQFIIKLENYSYYEYSCKTGLYTIETGRTNSPGYYMDATKAKTYYVELRPFEYGLANQIQFIESDSSVYPVIYNSPMKRLEPRISLYMRPRTRIGLTTSMGAGFNSMDMIEMENGKMSKFSYGGGFAIRLRFGYEPNDITDFCFEYSFQQSNLVPEISNGSMSFSKNLISLTPSLVIPVDPRNTMRFKLGAGLDYYFSNKLELELSQIPGGFNDEWIYEKAIGYHGRIIFEFNYSEVFSMYFGLKICTANYQFQSGGMYYPTSSEMTNPSGAGIDFEYGINFHF